MELIFAVKAEFHKCFLNDYEFIKLNREGALYRLYALHDSIYA